MPYHEHEPCASCKMGVHIATGGRGCPRTCSVVIETVRDRRECNMPCPCGDDRHNREIGP
jgi:hypothetical protein